MVGLRGVRMGGGEDEKVQSQIQNFMVWIFMGSNLSWRGVWGSSTKKNLEIWSALGAILGLLRVSS